MNQPPAANRLLKTEELAERWQVSVSGLCTDRSLKQGPPYVKIGGRVRYRLADIEAYEEANLQVAA